MKGRLVKSFVEDKLGECSNKKKVIQCEAHALEIKGHQLNSSKGLFPSYCTARLSASTLVIACASFPSLSKCDSSR